MKTRTKIILTGIVLTGCAFLININRKQAGIIQNQKTTIDGLLRDVKNLSYHLGKRQ